jgi:hypothetical protein
VNPVDHPTVTDPAASGTSRNVPCSFDRERSISMTTALFNLRINIAKLIRSASPGIYITLDVHSATRNHQDSRHAEESHPVSHCYALAAAVTRAAALLVHVSPFAHVWPHVDVTARHIPRFP